jgi:hypothetical protein
MDWTKTETESGVSAEPEDYFKTLAEVRRSWRLPGSWNDLMDLARRWARHAPEEAFATLFEVLSDVAEFDSSTRLNILGAVAFEWGRIDGDAALAAAGLVEDQVLRERLIESAILGFAEGDPADAFERIQSLPQHLKLVSRVFGEWGEQDVAAAMEHLDFDDNPTLQRKATIALTSGWASQDPAAALEWALTIADTRMRNEALRLIVYRSGEGARDPETGIRALEKMANSPSKREIADMFIEDWARRDPEGALDWVRKGTEAEMQERAFAMVVKNLGLSNRQAAMTLLEEIPAASVWRTQAIFDFIRTADPMDPDSTLDWARSLPEADKDTALAFVAQTWVYVNPNAAAAQAARLPDDLTATYLRTRIAIEWISSDPEASLKWATTLPGGSAGETYHAAFRQWAENAPARAAQYVGTIEDSRQRLDSFQLLTENWLRQNPAGVEAWVAEISPGPERDAAVEGIIEYYSVENPEAADAWARTLSDELRRKEWVERLHEQQKNVP